MTYAGTGGGSEFAEEAGYTYVGKEAAPHERGEEAPQAGPPWSCLCCGIACIAVFGLLIGWLMVPESGATPKMRISPPPQEETTTEQPAAKFREIVVMSMVVREVDWAALSASGHLRRHFRTELQQAIAIEAGHGVKPDDVEVQLSPGSVFVQAEFSPPHEVSAGLVRTALAASTTFSYTVISSLKMIQDLEDACTDYDGLDVGSIHVYLARREEPNVAGGPAAQDESSAQRSSDADGNHSSSGGSSRG